MALQTPQRNKRDQRFDNETVTRRVENFMDYANEFLLQASFYRVSDVGLQKAGIDLVLNDPNAKPGELKTMLVDEKFAVKYMNKELDTYSFELSSDNNKNQEGWFLSASSKTTHYELVWPRSTNDGHTIDSAEIMIVSKAAINKWLEERGINPALVLEQMRSQFHGDKLQQHYGCTYYTQTDFSGRATKHTMTIPYSADKRKTESVRVVQSLNGRENPINILMKKEDLRRIAEKSYVFQGPLHTEIARQQFQQAREQTYSIDSYITAQSWQQFEKTGRLPPQIEFVRGGVPKNKVSTCVRDGQRVLDLRDGDRLYIKTPYGRPVCVGVYGAKKQMWGITGGCSHVLGPEKSFSISDRIKESLQQGKLPFGFVVTNATFSKQLTLNDLDTPRHGDSILTFGENTQNKVVHLWYNAYTQRFVLNDNQFIRPEELTVFRGIPVVSERENDLQRAMMDRIVNCIPEIRKHEILSQTELFDKLTELLRNPQQLWDTPMNRASAEGIALKDLMVSKNLTEVQWAERRKITACLPNPQNTVAVHQIAGNLATQLSALSLEQRKDPDLLSSLLYRQQNIDIARASHVRGNPRTAPALDLDRIARDLGYPLQKNKPFVAWTNETISAMVEHLNKTCDKEKVIVLTGALPAWAMSAIAQGVEGSVYLRSDAYTTVSCAPLSKEQGVSSSQGVTFDVEKSPDGKTSTITWEIPQGRKLTEEDMRYIKVPEIDNCQNLVLQSKGKTPAFLLSAMSKTYSGNVDSIIFARHPDQYEDKRSHGGTCIASTDKSRIGEFISAQALSGQEQAKAHSVTAKFAYDRRSAGVQRAETLSKSGAERFCEHTSERAPALV